MNDATVIDLCSAFGGCWEHEFGMREKAVCKVVPCDISVDRRGGPNVWALEPRPWRMMKVCLCARVEGTRSGSG